MNSQGVPKWRCVFKKQQKPLVNYSLWLKLFFSIISFYRLHLEICHALKGHWIMAKLIFSTSALFSHPNTCNMNKGLVQVLMRNHLLDIKNLWVLLFTSLDTSTDSSKTDDHYKLKSFLSMFKDAIWLFVPIHLLINSPYWLLNLIGKYHDILSKRFEINCKYRKIANLMN